MEPEKTSEFVFAIPEPPRAVKITTPLAAKQKGPPQKAKLKKRLTLPKSLAFNPTENYLYKLTKELRTKAAKLKTPRGHINAAHAAATSEKFRRTVENLTPLQQRFFERLVKNSKCKSIFKKFEFEDEANAIAIWQISPKTYKYMSKIFALPSINTLAKTLNKISIGPGVSGPIFQELRERIGRRKFSERKFCVLVFGEIGIRPKLDHVPWDRIVGFADDGITRTGDVADHACVFMLRGVFRNWKQPISYAFSKSPMKPEIIVTFYKGIIEAAAAAGLRVIASVCDHRSNNVKAINQLLAETKQEAIFKGQEVKDNVINIGSCKVIPLFDPPTLLTSLRNHLLTKDLCFREKIRLKVVKWSHFEKTFCVDQKRRFKYLWKLRAGHVFPNRIGRRKVSSCAQALSLKGATLVNFLSEGNCLPSNACDTARFFYLIDRIFDSVNGGFGSADCKTGYAYYKPLRGRVDLDSPHLKCWMLGKKLFSKMEFVKSKPGDRAKPEVLDLWRRTLDGFILIKRRLGGLGYYDFPARSFNKDPLENFFGQIKQSRVRYPYPTCKQFVSYYKALFVKNFSRYYSKRSNCERDSTCVEITLGDLLGWRYI